MYPLYSDIREKLGEPEWHDQYGVPRYAPCHPDLMGIYDDWACLFVVKCQGCNREFDCAAGFTLFNGLHDLTREQIQERIDKKEDPSFVLPLFVSWGDAPWHDDENQCAGTTMTTDIVLIKKVWRRANGDWNQLAITNDLANELCDQHGNNGTSEV